jgi:hypothetical protein
MIKYNLKCINKHEFESWFSDSKEYEKLLRKKLLECIFCKSKKVNKSIMSPNVTQSRSIINTKHPSKKDYLKVKNDLIQLRKFIEKNFEFVGDKFASKVRNIYYDEENNKNIYGTVTEQEREDLKEEGIKLSTIPWVKKDN